MSQDKAADLTFGRGGLGPGEKFWRKVFPWLLENGFQLRRRYSPDWLPSFSGLDPSRYYKYVEFEDGPELLVSRHARI